MTTAEVQRYVKKMQAHAERVAESPTKAREVLVRAGIITPNGNLRRVYRSI